MKTNTGNRNRHVIPVASAIFKSKPGKRLVLTSNGPLFANDAEVSEKIMKVTHAAGPCDGGAIKLKIYLAAQNFGAFGFGFAKSLPVFKVYREINHVGREAGC